jgi:Tfp pilus assembly protein FimT
VNGGDPPVVNLRRAAIIAARDIPFQTSQEETDRVSSKSDTTSSPFQVVRGQAVARKKQRDVKVAGKRDERRNRREGKMNGHVRMMLM